MTKKETAVIINGKPVELDQYIRTIKEKGLECSPFDQTQNLGWLVKNIIGVCACALYNLEDNGEMTPKQQYDTLGASPIEVANVLQFAQTLIPLQELELISEIETALK
ncbi:hypothetical protein [Riemerella anatipestifer]|uniref:Uncharacterized protein n=1 Tax=Riemerella anatipestifer TaxID=34085 RepID=A0AAP6HH84_RIEAN|nr:hypothetical protein [Riemerella anatipestifer]MBT0549898.1 hypothetical protein [Riemerella anatipestifer]MBT0556641.1 hypothetical protein [Riemerella anatipestifer]MBT0560660.1 hypothetical protein [Riemerella anatipestifer]MCD5969570.1 hypothetical protein [Riemerella anatipestifer]MCO7355899.1 hypothetical protein [Riemerella anatipestifer]